MELENLISSKTELVMGWTKHRGIDQLVGNLSNEMLMGTYTRKR